MNRLSILSLVFLVGCNPVDKKLVKARLYHDGKTVGRWIWRAAETAAEKELEQLASEVTK